MFIDAEDKESVAMFEYLCETNPQCEPYMLELMVWALGLGSALGLGGGGGAASTTAAAAAFLASALTRLASWAF